MGEVSIRDLRNHGGEIVERVGHGERITVTRSGEPVVELSPLRGSPLPAEVVRERRRRLPVVDPDGLRRDIDGTLDPRL